MTAGTAAIDRPRRERFVSTLGSLYGSFTRVSMPTRVVIGLVVAYVWVFGNLTWKQQSNFGTFGFDMGIYDQGVWLLSRFHDPFVTVRGLDYFGHHVNLVTVLFVPFYWLGAGPHFLYLAETIWMAAGAIPVYLLARDRLEEPWLAVGLAGSYLLFPSLQWMNWWHFHPDTLIIAPLLFAWWFATRRNPVGFWISVVVALSCKEDAALAVFMLGLVVAWRLRAVRMGLIASGVGAMWFVLATRVVIPWANDGLSPLYADLFPGYGDSVFEIAWNMLTHPGQLWDQAVASGPGSPRTYYWQMLAPLALVPFLGLPLLAIAAPQLLVNVVSAHSPTHDFRYHYSAIIVAAVFLAAVEGVAVLRGRSLRSFAVGAIVASTIATNVMWSPSPLSAKYDSGIWARDPVDKHVAVNRALDLVPDGAGVSATYYLVPHLTHRRHIYEWPNPWVVAYWGVPGSDPPRPRDAQWIVVDRSLLGDSQSLLDSLLRTDFREVFDQDGIVVARRRR